ADAGVAPFGHRLVPLRAPEELHGLLPADPRERGLQHQLGVRRAVLLLLQRRADAPWKPGSSGVDQQARPRGCLRAGVRRRCPRVLGRRVQRVRRAGGPESHRVRRAVRAGWAAPPRWARGELPGSGWRPVRDALRLLMSLPGRWPRPLSPSRSWPPVRTGGFFARKRKAAALPRPLIRPFGAP